MNDFRFSAVAVGLHVLGGDDGALDDQQLDSRPRSPGRPAPRRSAATAGRPPCRRRPAASPIASVSRSSDTGCVVDLLQRGDHLVGIVGRVALREQVVDHPLRVRVPGPQPLAVQHPEAAEAGHRRATAGETMASRRLGQQRDLEPVGVDLPGGGDVRRRPGATGRDDGDVVQFVRRRAVRPMPISTSGTVAPRVRETRWTSASKGRRSRRRQAQARHARLRLSGRCSSAPLR